MLRSESPRVQAGSEAGECETRSGRGKAAAKVRAAQWRREYIAAATKPQASCQLGVLCGDPSCGSCPSAGSKTGEGEARSGRGTAAAKARALRQQWSCCCTAAMKPQVPRTPGVLCSRLPRASASSKTGEGEARSGRGASAAKARALHRLRGRSAEATKPQASRHLGMLRSELPHVLAVSEAGECETRSGRGKAAAKVRAAQWRREYSAAATQPQASCQLGVLCGNPSCGSCPSAGSKTGEGEARSGR
jgi:hypothetical protein